MLNIFKTKTDKHKDELIESYEKIATQSFYKIEMLEEEKQRLELENLQLRKEKSKLQNDIFEITKPQTK